MASLQFFFPASVPTVITLLVWTTFISLFLTLLRRLFRVAKFLLRLGSLYWCTHCKRLKDLYLVPVCPTLKQPNGARQYPFQFCHWGLPTQRPIPFYRLRAIIRRDLPDYHSYCFNKDDTRLNWEKLFLERLPACQGEERRPLSPPPRGILQPRTTAPPGHYIDVPPPGLTDEAKAYIQIQVNKHFEQKARQAQARDEHDQAEEVDQAEEDHRATIPKTLRPNNRSPPTPREAPTPRPRS